MQLDGVFLRGAGHVVQAESVSLNTQHAREIFLGDSVRIIDLPIKVNFIKMTAFSEVLASQELVIFVVEVHLDVEVGRVDIDEAREGLAVCLFGFLNEPDVHLVPDFGHIERR